MNKNLKLILKIGGILALLGLIVMFILRYTTKAHSPEEIITYEQDGLKLEVFYNRPYKKDRRIFGNLVPYNEVWRTGANEATTFETNQDILVDGSLLEAGKYTLWTIPMENSWKIMFNSKMYPWGINMNEEAYRDPQFDSLVLERPVEEINKELEQFTIFFEENGEFVNMVLAWDDTSIRIPIKEEEAPVGTSSI
ncbi:DUF2911 domain-containing protein [Christiangramia sp.]|uniref:DUF2911 domain-containing protein n=1 Tax=Christiangramia sp. TaxID=1931228 RepID=UPI002621DAD4|nr:DUF2911 domain-containing protein [Christiangramia sp.]